MIYTQNKQDENTFGAKNNHSSQVSKTNLSLRQESTLMKQADRSSLVNQSVGSLNRSVNRNGMVC